MKQSLPECKELIKLTNSEKKSIFSGQMVPVSWCWNSSGNLVVSREREREINRESNGIDSSAEERERKKEKERR